MGAIRNTIEKNTNRCHDSTSMGFLTNSHSMESAKLHILPNIML
jgi:hypothetical protein